MSGIPRIVLVLIVLAAIIGGAIGIYLFNKPVKSIKNVKPEFFMDSNDFYNSFEKDDSVALLQYKEKVIQLTGTVEKIVRNDSNYTILLKTPSSLGNIKCVLDPTVDKEIQTDANGEISLKCVCSGVSKVEDLGLTILDVELTGCILVSGD